MNRNNLRGMCLLVLFGILAAGLWPFNPYPKNEVSWIPNENGLRFGDYGTVLSSGPIRMINSQDAGSCSLEIWLRPGARIDSNIILAFYTPENPLQFRIGQANADLLMVRDIPNGQHGFGSDIIEIDDAFDPNKTLLIAITSGPQKTSAYLNGVQAQTSPRFGLTTKDFNGQIVIGNSPLENYSWSGDLWGLAIYNRELTAAQTMQHYETWTKSGRAEPGENEGTVALYRFDERSGSVVHNHVGSEPDLYIPDHYMILRQAFLSPPWKEFQSNWTYWKGVIENVVAFIPLGFFFCAYFSWKRHCKQAMILTIVLGGAVSLTIEVLQAFIPMRDSGVTDIITNTIGTGIGAMLYSSRPGKDLLAKIGFQIKQEVLSA